MGENEGENTFTRAFLLTNDTPTRVTERSKFDERHARTYGIIQRDDSDDFVQAKVTREIEDNRFTIRTSAPKVKVSWMVTGVRRDAYVRDNPLAVEQVKPQAERGTLLYDAAADRKNRTR